MSFLEEINGKYGQLSPVQKRIADYIFTYPEEVCFNSLKELSQALGVTEVTILRFVKKVGLTSFVEMKKKLKDYLQTRFSQDETQGYPAGRSGVKMGQDLDKEEMYRNFVENEIRVLKSTYMQNGIERVLNAVSIIKGASSVYVVGNELGTSLASYLTRRLLTIGIRAVDLAQESRAIYNNYMTHVGPEDAVIIFSNPGYAKHLVNTSKYLNKKRVPQIVITDREASPVAEYATEILLCDNHDLYFYNSVLGFFSIASLLTYFTAMNDPEETARLRGRLSETREAIGSITMVKERRN